MARITVEDCLKQVENRFELVLMASKRARELSKKVQNQYVFGGKSIWGALIDAACERYGWTFDYVVWGISYNNT